MDPIIYENGHYVFNRGEVHGSINVTYFICVGFGNTRFLGGRSHFTENVFHLEIDTQIPRLDGSGEINAVGNLAAFRMGGQGNTI